MMKALTLVSNGHFRLERRSRPIASPDSYLIRIDAAGICGSDLPRAFQNKAYHYPLVMGHEIAGTVEEAPKGGRIGRGQQVVVFPLLPDMSEAVNQIGEYAVSKNYDYYGSRRDGGFQQYLSVPEFNVLPLPHPLDPALACMTEPCAVAYHAASKPGIEPGMSALVIGAGPIGNMTAQWLRIRGCRPVIVSETDHYKRQIAHDMGFETVDPMSEDLVETVRSRTGGGVDIAIEACGLPETFRQAAAAAGLFGQVVFLGNIHGDFSLPEEEFSSILRRELTIRAAWNSKTAPRGRDEWSRVLNAMDGDLKLNELISHRVPLEDGADILQAMHHQSIWYNKVILTNGKQQ